jgi:hypothetical protein
LIARSLQISGGPSLFSTLPSGDRLLSSLDKLRAFTKK